MAFWERPSCVYATLTLDKRMEVRALPTRMATTSSPIHYLCSWVHISLDRFAFYLPSFYFILISNNFLFFLSFPLT